MCWPRQTTGDHNTDCLEYGSSSQARTRFIGWLQLLRAPNVLTVPGDPLAGYLLASVCKSGSDYSTVGAIAATIPSLMLYGAGLLLNDYCDIEEDGRDRPNRPLPKGIVQPRTVIRVFGVLSAVAVVLAWILAGYPAAIVAGTLFIVIAAYNTKSKRIHILGSLNMGLCRGLSLLLGATIAVDFSALTYPSILMSACLLTLYISVVTTIASQETQVHPIGVKVYLPSVVLLLGFSGLFIMSRPTDTIMLTMFLSLATAAILYTASCGFRLSGSPTPSLVQRTIGQYIRGLFLIQAAMVAFVGECECVLAMILCFLWPISAYLARKFYAS